MDDDQAATLGRRALLTLAATFGAHAALVSTHRGEFWPLSIYPMFSLAGRPWTRALMLDVTGARPAGWGPWKLDALPGEPVSTHSVSVNTNDMAKFIQLTDVWTRERLQTLRTLWQPALERGRTLLFLRADGRLLGEDRSVDIRLEGLVLMSTGGTVLNPELKAEEALS